MALFAEEAAVVSVFVARRVLEAETAIALTAETFAQAVLDADRFPDNRQEARDRIYAIARDRIGRFLTSDTVETSALRALGLSVPILDDGELRRLEEDSGITTLIARAHAHLDLVDDPERAVLSRFLSHQRSRLRLATEMDLDEGTVRLLISRGLRRIALQLDARHAPAIV